MGAAPAGRLWLARHGQTAYNLEGRFQGWLPVPLDDARPRAGARARRGRRAACAGGARREPARPRARRRRRSSPSAIGLEPVPDERFAETDAGDWTDRMLRRRDRRGPRRVRPLRRARHDVGLPGRRALRRPAGARARGRSRTGAPARSRGPVLVVCHGVTSSGSRCWALSGERRRGPARQREHRGAVTRLARVVFGLLVVECVRAPSSSPSSSSRRRRSSRASRSRCPVISPNRDGRLDRQRVTFRLKRADTVDVAVVNDQGDVVRELASGKHLRRLPPAAAEPRVGRARRARPPGAGRHLPDPHHAARRGTQRRSCRGRSASTAPPPAPADPRRSARPRERAAARAAAAPGRRARAHPPVRPVALRGAAHLPHVARRAAAADDDRDPRRRDDGELGRHGRRGASGARRRRTSSSRRCATRRATSARPCR